MNCKTRSNCPITFALDHIGDRWSLLILRDMFFADKRYYDEFAASEEGISTNILATRLKQLEADGLISRETDSQNRRRKVYRPTQKALDLLPMMVELVLWSAAYDSDTGAPDGLVAAMRDDRAGVISNIQNRFELR